MALAELLDRHRIQYEVEEIFLSGDSYILVDSFLKDQMLAIEVDGSAHDSQKKYVGESTMALAPEDGSNLNRLFTAMRSLNELDIAEIRCVGCGLLRPALHGSISTKTSTSVRVAAP